MKTCSFCGKPSKRYATSARDPWAMDYHCFRLFCRISHWISLRVRNFNR